MGFDNECILNIQSLAGEYFCPVCRLLVYPNEAFQSQCTHLYCKPCLKSIAGTTRACPYDGYLVTEADSKLLIESNKTLAATIGKIAVHCLYHRSGCTWQGPLSECTSHCSGCAFGNSPVVCNRCGIQIVHRQVQEHAQICPGVQPHLQQGQGVQDSAATGTTAAADQSQTASQSGTQTAQAQASQTTTGPLSGHDPNQQTNANTQVQSVAVAAVTTPEQCYQQQYQQYYQQYPGYDPYQQTYQHYYPHQQQAIQQYQQHPQHVQGQHQPQAQPQPQHQPQVQPQEHNYVQAQVAAQHQNQPQVNPQQQLHPVVQPQMQSQTHPPLPGHLHPQPYPQAQPQSIQPHPQQQVQMSQYQQPHSQMLHPQPQIQLQPHSQVHPRPHSLPQSQPLSQSQAPVQYHSHPHPHPSQPNQPPNPNVQTHTQHPLAPVTGPHSYPQPQALQQMQLGAPQHHPMHILPQSGPLPQQPAEMPSQFPQQPQMHPPQSHAPVPSQQQPAFLPSQGQVPSVPPAQQQLINPHVLQPGHLVHQRPIVQPLQKPFPQQYLQQQQQQPFPGKTSVLVQNQLHQQLPMQSQLRPQVPPHSVQKNSHAYLQPQQNVAHGLQPHQSQNYVGRPMIPNHGGHSHPFPQSPSAAQVRPMQLAANQPSAEARTLKSGTGVKSMDDGQKLVGGDRDTSLVGTLAKDTDCVSQTAENGSAEPAIKPMMKDGTKHDLEPSPGGKSVEIVAEEQKDANDVPKQEDHFSVDDSSLQQAKSFKEHRGKLPKDAVVPVSTGTNKGSQALPVASAHIPDSSTPDVTPQGNSRTPLTGGDPSQHGYQERNLSQSQFTPQGPGVDEFRGFPPHGQVQGKGFGHPAPVADQGRHQQPLMQYGPSSHQQRPVAPSMLQPVPPPGLPHQAQVPRRPPILLRPQGLGNLPLAGQPLNPPEHIQPPVKQPYGSLHPEVLLSGIPGPGSTLSFGRGPSHLGPSQRSFELLSSASQGHYNQGHAPLSHAGLPRISQGEPPVGGVPQGAVPSVSSDLHSGIMERAQLHGPEGQFGQHRPINPTETEIFSNQGSHHFDARKPDSHLPETSESGPFGPPPGFESNVMRMNGPPGLDSMSAPGLQDERSRPLSGDHFPMEPARRLDRGEFEDPKQFPRHSHLDTDPAPKFGSNFSTSTPIDRGACGFIADVASRPLDKAPLGLNYDAGLKLEPGAGGVPSRFLPPYLPAGTLHPNDAGEKTYMAGLDDNVGRADTSRTHPDFRDAIARFGQHPRSPGGEKLGVPTRGVGGLSGVPRNQSGLDDVDGRESHPFGEGPISFSLPSDPVANSFHASRLPALPSHLRRVELDGQDILPRHLWRGELLDPGHLRLGERAGFGAFSGHARIRELAGPGNFPHHLPLGESFGGKLSHPQLGEPGFRSSCALQGFPTDSGFYKGGLDSFERKGKTASMGWCRICKVDCETVEALDLHSQTREHQKMTMDMVLSIKQHNAKKHKTSKDHALLEEASKSRSTGHEGRGNKP